MFSLIFLYLFTSLLILITARRPMQLLLLFEFVVLIIMYLTGLFYMPINELFGTTKFFETLMFIFNIFNIGVNHIYLTNFFKNLNKPFPIKKHISVEEDNELTGLFLQPENKLSADEIRIEEQKAVKKTTEPEILEVQGEVVFDIPDTKPKHKKILDPNVFFKKYRGRTKY